MFGAGGGTSSYSEIEETDVVLLWGSNARETHPIFFHHLLKGVHAGARLFVVDPRRTASAQWADTWLGLDVGSDIALSNTMAREIIHADLHNRAFVERATVGFEEYAASVESFTLEEGERVTGVPAAVIRETAHAFARADRAMICWTLGITEHHNAVDNVLSLINLGLLCGHVGRYGSGLNPLRGQNNVQGGGDMGAIPNKLPGFQDIERDARRPGTLRGGLGRADPAQLRLAPDADVPRHGARRAADALRHRREPRAVGGGHRAGATAPRGARLPRRPGHRHDEDGRDGGRRPAVLGLVVRDRGNGDEQRAPRPAGAQGPRPTRGGEGRHLDPGPAGRSGSASTGATRRPSRRGTSFARSRPMHGGMSWERLERLGGIQWPCPDESHPGRSSSTAGCGRSRSKGLPAPFSVVEARPPFEALDADYPIRLTTGRRLESYNTGAQSNLYRSPLHRGESLDLSPEDAERLELSEGEIVRVSSRRGTVDAPVRIDPSLRAGPRVHDLPLPR